jgi:exonuclease VII small subunit
MAKNPAPVPVEELTYEAALSELEQIVSSLEGEQNPLETAMLISKWRSEACNWVCFLKTAS